MTCFMCDKDAGPDAVKAGKHLFHKDCYIEYLKIIKSLSVQYAQEKSD